MDLRLGEGLILAKGFEVIGQLVHCGHTAENNAHIGQSHKPTEAPGRHALVRTESLQVCLCTLGQLINELAATDGLHYPYRNVVFCEKLALFLGTLKGPVKVVKLDLAELHFVACRLEKLRKVFGQTVGGEAEMLDPAKALLLHEVVYDSPALVEKDVNGGLADVVKKVEIEILNTALLQLMLEDDRGIVAVKDLVTRVLRRKIIALTGIL